MSENVRREGNTDSPKVDTEYGERRGNEPGGSGPRRVEDVRRDREAEHGSSAGYAASDTDRGTSWVSVVLGWLAALGAGLILSGIVGGIVGAILGTGSARQSATEGGMAGLIGLLITLLLAFII